MKPPKKKKKKKKGDKNPTPSEPVQSYAPEVEEKRQRFPGLSLPNDTDRAMDLAKPEPGSEEDKGLNEDTKVASDALNDVSL